MMLAAKTEKELLAAFEPRILSTVPYERQIWQARFSPCGKYLFAAGYDALIPRWQLQQQEAGSPSLEPLEPLGEHHGWIQCLDFATAAQRLLTADSWGKLCCWNYQQETPGTVWALDEAHDGWIRGLHCSPDGQWVATVGNDHALRIWQVADGKRIADIPHDSRLFSVRFHPDGKSIYTGDLEGVVRRWSFDPSGPESSVLQTYDAQTLYQLHRIQHCGGARCLSLSADGRYLLVAGQKTPQGGFATGTPCALVFEVENAKLIREMPIGGTNDGFMYDVRFHADGFVMGTSSAFPGKGHLWFWLPESDKPFYSSNKLANGRSLEMHPEGKYWAMVISDAPNANGRPLKDGEYQGGSAKIHLLALGAEAT